MNRLRNHGVRLAAAAALALVLTAAARADLNITESPTSRTVPKGTSATYQISSNDLCLVYVVSAPAGATLNLWSFSVAPGSPVTLSVGTANVAIGSHKIKLNAMGIFVGTDTDYLTLKVTDKGSFNLTAWSVPASIPRGGSGSVTIVSTASGGFTSTVNLSPPAIGGCTVSYTPSGSISANGATTLNISAAATAALGTRNVTLLGSGGLLQDSVTFSFQVVEPSFTLAASPTTIIAERGQTKTFTVTTTPIGAILSNVSVSQSVGVPGATITPGITTMSSSASQTFTIVVGEFATFGKYTLHLQGSAAGTTKNASVTLVIGPRPVVAYDAPYALIPDYNGSGYGLYRPVTVTSTARIQSIAVRVAITHPWRGDLSLALEDPWGTFHVLKNWNYDDGGQDIVTVYPTVTAPVDSLNALLGMNPAGSWKFWAVDGIGGFVGVLNEWSLVINGEQTMNPNASIPDNVSMGAISECAFAGSGTVKQIRVRVNITHGYRGDLKVTLISPGGVEVVLHDHTGGSADNLFVLYPDGAAAPALANLANTPIAGVWKLKVADEGTNTEGGVTRRFNSWTLSIEPN